MIFVLFGFGFYDIVNEAQILLMLICGGGGGGVLQNALTLIFAWCSQRIK